MINIRRYPTDTGAGRRRIFYINKKKFISPSKKSSSKYPPETNLHNLIEIAKEKKYQVIVRTSKGTWYLKCHVNDVGYKSLKNILITNTALHYKTKSIAYLLKL